MGHLNIEVHLSQIQHEILNEVQSPLGCSNLSNEKWKTVLYLANDPNLVMKKADKKQKRKE